MDTAPRHFHANERFFIEISFEEPLPEGSLPLAEFAGPIGPGGPALTFWTAMSQAAVDTPSDRSVRLVGKIPEEAPPGMYRVTHVEVRWTAEMPLSWEAVSVPIAHLGRDVLIKVDEPLEQSQPTIPRIVQAG